MLYKTQWNYLALSFCVKLLEFAHTSACVCVSCFCASDAHDFFAECFINCQQSMRKRRVTATRELQHNTFLRKFFALGALVPAVLLATWWVRPPSMTSGVDNPTTVVKWHSHQSRSVTHSCSGLTRYRTQLCWFQTHLMMCDFIDLFECGAR